MTIKKFLLLFLLQWVILTFLKAWFFKNQLFANPGLDQLFYWFATVVVVAALVRRFDYISFLEAFLVFIVWTLGDLLLDLVLLSPFTGLSMYAAGEYWWGIFFMDAALMVFHKKKHIKIRHDLQAHH